MARVLHVVESLQAGGAERMVAEFARLHDRSRYQPEVCCVLSSGPFAGPLERAGIPVHVLGRRSRLDFGALFRLARIMRKRRFDIVHNHNTTALVIGLPAAVLAGVRTVVRTEHNVAGDRGRARRILSRLAALREDAQIAVSEEVRRSHIEDGRIPPARFVTIRNGIDGGGVASDGARESVRRELGIPADAFVCLNVGSLTRQKNRRTLLRAAAELRGKADVWFLVAGAGPEEAGLKRLAGELGVADTVSFLGQRLDVPDLLAASDAFVLSSDWEGLPITILEAMSAGVPCVTTSVGGIPEVLTDEVSGILVPPGDHVALAGGIRRLARDPELRTRLSAAAGREFRRRFTSEQMVRQTEALYDLATCGRVALARDGRIRILYVIGQLGLGGAERQMAELVTRVPTDLFEPVVCCLSGSGAVGDVIEDADLRVIYLEKRHGILSGATLKLMGVIARERPTVLHSYLFSASWRSLLAGRLMRVPLVVTSVRNVDIHTRLAPRVTEWLLSGLNDRVIANAEAVKDYVSSRHLTPREKIEVIYNGISLERAGTGCSRTPTEGGRVAMIASLTAKKGHETFLEAAGLVRERLPRTTFRLIGGGPLRSEVAARIEELGLGEFVTLLGPREDIDRQLADVDLSVLTSLKEGCSNVVIESMAAGCPVVATDVGGNRELIEDGRSGYLVPAGDARAVADRIVELLGDAELRRRMGDAGRERARSRFAAERMVEETVGFYLRTLEARAPGLEAWARLSSEREPGGAA